MELHKTTAVSLLHVLIQALEHIPVPVTKDIPEMEKPAEVRSGIWKTQSSFYSLTIGWAITETWQTFSRNISLNIFNQQLKQLTTNLLYSPVFRFTSSSNITRHSTKMWCPFSVIKAYTSTPQPNDMMFQNK